MSTTNPYQYLYQTAQNAVSGWSANSIAPGAIVNPFTNVERVVQQARSNSTRTTPLTAEDFRTQSLNLNDPRLASRDYSSVPRSQDVQLGASVSAYGVGSTGVQVPAYLTEAVNRLNASQSSAAQAQDEYRQQLLNAVLGGNYLAAEALRAASVQPGTSVAFGSQVADPTVGIGYAAQSLAGAQESRARTQEYRRATSRTSDLTRQLADLQEQITSSSSQSPFLTTGSTGIGDLYLQRRNIQRELERQQQALAQGGGYRPSAWASAFPTLSLTR